MFSSRVTIAEGEPASRWCGRRRGWGGWPKSWQRRVAVVEVHRARLPASDSPHQRYEDDRPDVVVAHGAAEDAGVHPLEDELEQAGGAGPHRVEVPVDETGHHEVLRRPDHPVERTPVLQLLAAAQRGDQAVFDDHGAVVDDVPVVAGQGYDGIPDHQQPAHGVRRSTRGAIARGCRPCPRTGTRSWC